MCVGGGDVGGSNTDGGKCTRCINVNTYLSHLRASGFDIRGHMINSLFKIWHVMFGQRRKHFLQVTKWKNITTILDGNILQDEIL